MYDMCKKYSGDEEVIESLTKNTKKIFRYKVIRCYML